MKIVFINFHPVDPQFYKNVALTLEKRGHKVLFLILEKEQIIDKIAKSFGFKTKIVGEIKPSFKQKLLHLPKIMFKILWEISKFRPDLLVSATSPYAGLAAKLTKTKAIGFTDTETATFNNNLSFKLFDSILTPSCFLKDVIKQKHIPFTGYKEIAYLHPLWFNRNQNILEKLQLKIEDKIVLMRFSALTAVHDNGLKSVGVISKNKILKYINEIEEYAKVFISMSERDLGPEFKQYKLEIEPHEYTNLLSFCSLYIGEGTTTASEAGVLGVPWIALRPEPLGYLNDQEEKFGLGFRTDDIDYAFKTAIEWIKKDSLKKEWKLKQKKLLTEKIDVSSFLIWFIENYPASHKIMINNPEFQKKFK